MITRVKAALNGGGPAPAPSTPQQIAIEARNAIAAGAFAVHVHPRDAAGRESLAPGDVAAVVDAVENVGITTAAWIEPDPAKRLALIRGWIRLPKFASVNMDEDGAVAVAELLLRRGVAVELGLPTIESSERMMRSGIWKRALRILLEAQEQTLDAALATVAAIEEIINGCSLPRLLHGFDAMTWPLIAEAAQRKWDTRVGLEDTLVLPDGSPAHSNAQLIEAAWRVIAKNQPG
jgi:uncharacterized protein (DUF849 family)